MAAHGKTRTKSRGNAGKPWTPGNPGNTGGKKGRSGRPPKRFKSFLAELRQDPVVQGQLAKLLKDRNAKHYPAALKVLTDYDDEAPANLTPEERAARVQEFLRLAAERQAQGHQAPA